MILILILFIFCVVTRFVWGISNGSEQVIFFGFMFAGFTMWFYYQLFKLMKRCFHESKQS